MTPETLEHLRHQYNQLRRQYTLSTLQLVSQLDELEARISKLEREVLDGSKTATKPQ